MGANDLILMQLLAAHVDMIRYEAQLQQQILQVIEQLNKDMAARLIDIDPTEPVGLSFRRKRLDKLAEAVADLVGEQYGVISALHAAELTQLVEISSELIVNAINESITLELAKPIRNVAQLEAIAKDALIEGAPSATWWERQSTDLAHRFEDQMRQGMEQGETIGQMVTRLRGTRENGYTDGLMQTSRHNANALVRTSVMSAANDAYLATYEKNPDVVKGIMQVSTLDNRTTPVCRAYDRACWDAQTKKPIKGTKLPFAGGTPRHWGCRSVITPITKSWAEMAKESGGDTKFAARLDELLSSGSRASVDGEVPREMSYPEWFAAQSKSRQLEILGPGRWEMWNAGKLTFQQMIDMRGNPLTLAQLRARYTKQ